MFDNIVRLLNWSPMSATHINKQDLSGFLLDF